MESVSTATNNNKQQLQQHRTTSVDNSNWWYNTTTVVPVVAVSKNITQPNTSTNMKDDSYPQSIHELEELLRYFTLLSTRQSNHSTCTSGSGIDDATNKDDDGDNDRMMMRSSTKNIDDDDDDDDDHFCICYYPIPDIGWLGGSRYFQTMHRRRCTLPDRVLPPWRRRRSITGLLEEYEYDDNKYDYDCDDDCYNDDNDDDKHRLDDQYTNDVNHDDTVDFRFSHLLFTSSLTATSNPTSTTTTPNDSTTTALLVSTTKPTNKNDHPVSDTSNSVLSLAGISPTTSPPPPSPPRQLSYLPPSSLYHSRQQQRKSCHVRWIDLRSSTHHYNHNKNNNDDDDRNHDNTIAQNLCTSREQLVQLLPQLFYYNYSNDTDNDDD